MPPEPPRRRPPGGVLEEFAAQAPHTPVPPAPVAAPTAPPPADRRSPPKEYRAPRPKPVALPPLQAPPAPSFREDSEEHTTLGLGPPSAPPGEDGDRPSTVQAIRSANSLSLELAERNARIAEKDAEIARLKASNGDDPLFDAAAYFKYWRTQALKLFIPLVAIAFAGSVAISMLNRAYVELKVDNTDAKTDAQKRETDPLVARLTCLETRERLRAERTVCTEAQTRSAVERDSGYNLTALSQTNVAWSSDKVGRWFPERGCPAEPALTCDIPPPPK